MWQIRDSRHARTGPAGAMLAITASVMVGCVPEAPGGADDPVGPGTPGPEARYSVQLRWIAPETDAEGETLGDLEGFRLYFAPASERLMETGGSIEVGLEAEGLVTGLSAGEWHFAVTAVDTAGNESLPSESVQVEVGVR